jgi:hypothetical protein
MGNKIQKFVERVVTLRLDQNASVYQTDQRKWCRAGWPPATVEPFALNEYTVAAHQEAKPLWRLETLGRPVL